MRVAYVLFSVIGILFVLYGIRATRSNDVVVLYRIKSSLTNRDVTDIKKYNRSYGTLFIINGIILLAFGAMFYFVNDITSLSKITLLLPLLALELVIVNWFICYKYSVRRKTHKLINWH